MIFVAVDYSFIYFIGGGGGGGGGKKKKRGTDFSAR